MMESGERLYLSGTVLDEEHRCGIRELCRLCGVTDEQVAEMMEEGLIHQPDPDPQQWCFTIVEVRRIQTALHLQRDLQVNLPGCALALDLLDQLDHLRRLLRGR